MANDKAIQASEEELEEARAAIAQGMPELVEPSTIAAAIDECLTRRRMDERGSGLTARLGGSHTTHCEKAASRKLQWNLYAELTAPVGMVRLEELDEAAIVILGVWGKQLREEVEKLKIEIREAGGYMLPEAPADPEAGEAN